jgi:carboxyl-terminal processing protease
MTKKLKVLIIVSLLTWLSLACGCLPGVQVLFPETAPATEPPATSAPAPIPGIVGEAWDIIFRDYVEKDSLDADELGRGAIEGMVEALDDPYSSYLDPEMYQLSLSDFSGSFEGIGANVADRDGQIVIISPIPGSPADQAGIRAGDIILEIDGASTEDMSLTEAVLLVRGPRGTAVRLLVLHEGETEPVEIEIVRDEIELESVSLEMRGDLALITITYFSGRTDEEMASVMESVVDEAAGIILDLRSNPGGTLPAVVDVASYFLTEGTVVDVVDNQGEHTTMSVEPKRLTTDLPLVVLVDEFSASGSEVLAGALQDHGRAVVAGRTTFGKGSVNVLQQLSDGSGIYITTGRWLTPNGRLIEGKGIEPDYELELEGEAAIQWAIDYLQSGVAETALLPVL